MRALRILKNSLVSALRNIFRNLSLSIASISCIVITLLTVSISLILSNNLNKFTTDIENDLTIVTFIKSSATSEDIDELKLNLNALPNIEKIEYQSKDELKQSLMEENEIFNNVMSKWDEDENPLRAVFTVTVHEIDKIGETATTIKNLQNVDIVKYGEGKVEQIISIFNFIKRLNIVSVGALIFITAFLISNTIKITIYSRKKEIDIMRLVGTGNTVIKLPFVFEGLFLGVLGSFIPIICTIYGYVLLYDKMGGVLFTDIVTLIPPYNFVFRISLILLIIGALVGMFGSYKAVRKYLKI